MENSHLYLGSERVKMGANTKCNITCCSKGPFTQAIFVVKLNSIFVTQLNAILVTLKLQLQNHAFKSAVISVQF